MKKLLRDYGMCCFWALFFVLLATKAQALDEPKEVPDASKPAESQTATKVEQVKTKQVVVLGAAKRIEPQITVNKRVPPNVRVGDSIELSISGNLAAYRKFATDERKEITLFLNGVEAFIEPESFDDQGLLVRFHLERNEKNKKLWSSLFRDPFSQRKARKVRASIGFAGESARPEGMDFKLQIFKLDVSFFFWLCFLVVLLVTLFWLTLKRDLLRAGPAPLPYSLGRCQMAWWFFLILTSYVVIWLITGDRDTIPASLLVLMGISAATAAGAVLVDKTVIGLPSLKVAEIRKYRQEVWDAKQALAAARKAAAGFVGVDPGAAGPQARLAFASQTMATVLAKGRAPNILTDILSDGEGTITLHRFQNLVWTLVLGIIFLVSVFNELTMPEFSNTLLTLMGISGATYVGLKLPEPPK